MFPTGGSMPRSIRGFCAVGFIVSLFLVLAATTSLAASVKRVVVIAKAPDDIRKAVEDNGYDVQLDDGWTVQFWLSRVLPTGSNPSAGALYPELSNGEFVAVVQFPKGFSDFRGQAVPAGIYTLR